VQLEKDQKQRTHAAPGAQRLWQSSWLARRLMAACSLPRPQKLARPRNAEAPGAGRERSGSAFITRVLANLRYARAPTSGSCAQAIAASGAACVAPERRLLCTPMRAEQAARETQEEDGQVWPLH